MVVAATVVLVLIAGNAIVKRNFTGKPTFCQQLEGAINGRKSYAWIALADELVKLLSREMLMSFEEGEQDGIALLRLLQTNPFQVLMKTVLGFAQRFARNRYLVINALLKHPNRQAYA